MGNTLTRTPYYLWLDKLGLEFPLIALAWSWLLGQSMSLVYLPSAPYIMLALVVWSSVLTVRLCRHEAAQNSEENFPGGRWSMISIIVLSLSAVLWMALYMVGFGIIEFCKYPLILIICYGWLYLFSVGTRRLPVLALFCGGLAFAYGCAVPVWYSAAVYSVWAFLVDQRTLYIAVLMVMFLISLELWKEEDRDWENGVHADEEEEEARLLVWVSFPLLVLSAFSLFFAYNNGTDSEWVFYSIAISAGLLHILNKYHNRFSMPMLKVLSFICMVLPATIRYV